MSPKTRELFEAALAVQTNAYAPYSHFRVGCALRTDRGTVFVGANVENAAYPQGACAEASAVCAMASAGERTIVEVVVVADGDDLSTCCGGCRQRLREFAALDVPIHCAGREGIRATFTLDQLLPQSFGPENLAAF